MRRRWRLVRVVAATLVAAAAAALASVAANAATGSTVTWWPSWLPSMNDNFLFWLAGSIAAVAGSALLVVWAQRRYDSATVELVPVQQRLEPWIVSRPAEVDRIVRAVVGQRGAGTVGITTAVHGAGGFGKTTVARLVRSDRRVLRRFGGGIFWVTVGRDARRGTLVEKVNDLVRRVDSGRAQPFTDLRQAAEHLAAVLADGPRRLIVLDDVWFEDQLAAFPVAGRCARLVTTRVSSLVAGQTVPVRAEQPPAGQAGPKRVDQPPAGQAVPKRVDQPPTGQAVPKRVDQPPTGQAVRVRVDQMSAGQARRVLTADLPGLPAASVAALLAETGRWPLLLRLTNRNLVAQAQSTTDLAAVVDDLLRRLRRDGRVRAVGQLPGVESGRLDVDDPDQRNQAVAATIEASAGLLTDEERVRLTELAIFAEDEAVPVTLVAALWAATGGLDDAGTRLLCSRLSDLALLTLTANDAGGTIGVHDVVREYLRELATDRLVRLHRLMVDRVAAGLPRAPAGPGIAGAVVVAWWELPYEERYLREHLVEHLLAAGRIMEAESLTTDLRWVASRLDEAGPIGPFRDLTTVDSPRANRLGRLFTRTAHLLTPTDPPYSQVDVLYSRVDHDVEWGPQARFLAERERRTRLALRNAGPLPDLPHPATLHILTGHGDAVDAMALSRDGSRLVTAGSDETVRVWDPDTGIQRLVISDIGYWVCDLALSPDSAWLVTAGSRGNVHTWHLGTGARTARMAGHTGLVFAVRVSPDGSWLATCSDDKTVRIWDPATGARRIVLKDQSGTRHSMAMSPRGDWLATIGGDRVVRVWDPTSGVRRSELPGDVRFLFAVDDTRLATVDDDKTVRIWDAITGTHQVDLAGRVPSVQAMAISACGTWLASLGDDKTVHLWNLITGAPRGTLGNSFGGADAMAIAPDGTWLAVAGWGGNVAIVDAHGGPPRERLAGHTSQVEIMLIPPTGAWLATAGRDGTVRIWDTAPAVHDADRTGAFDVVPTVAVSPDGVRCAAGGRRARILDVGGGAPAMTLAGQKGLVRAAAFSPGGAWLATADDYGSVWIRDAGTGLPKTELKGHTKAVYAMAVAPDGTWLATAGQEGVVRIWDPSTGAQRVEWIADAKAVYSIAVAPDRTWLATAGQEGVVRIWDPSTGARISEFGGDAGRTNAVASHGGWLATAGEEGRVEVWDLSTGTRWAELTGHTGRVNAVAVSPSGTWLATAGEDRTLRIWDLAAGACAAVMPVERPLRCCAWGAGDRHVVAGGLAGLYRFAVDRPA